MTRPVIALLGRKDEPTDAVEEYCKNLASALQLHGFEMQLRRVPWETRGWSDALNALRLQAAGWRNSWVFVQYTALAWSSRGFPRRFLRVLKLLRGAGAKVSVVFHDVEPYSGSRWIDKLRRRVQVDTMRSVLNHADLAVFTVPPEKLPWIESAPANAVFIPVGPNLPLPESPLPPLPHTALTVGVFSITGGSAGAVETTTIVEVMRDAAQRVGPLRLLVFGRHAELREATLRAGLSDLPVQLQVEGVLSDIEVVERFRECDVMLFIRGGISTRRGSAIAGIACGIPTVAYAGSETSPPITDAGVTLVSPQSLQELKDALVHLLSNKDARSAAAAANKKIYREHFAWPTIATKYASRLLM